MHARTLVTALAAAVSAFAAPAVDAKPSVGAAPAAKEKKLGKIGKAPTAAATGLGTRTSGLSYAAIPPSAFQPMMWNSAASGPYATGSVATFDKGVAPVLLPPGARIREISCFGMWKSQVNPGKAIRLRRLSHANTGAGEILAKVVVKPGSGVRRLDASVDHVVDNFTSSYQLDIVFNAKPELRACRIGYEPAS